MAKEQKDGQASTAEKKTSKRRRKSDNVSGQTNQLFEQDSKPPDRPI